jgi:hypothetical protein
MNGAEVFFDTNVFAHAQDHDVPESAVDRRRRRH